MTNPLLPAAIDAARAICLDTHGHDDLGLDADLLAWYDAHLTDWNFDDCVADMLLL
jgi:hypothetical protein